MAFDKRNLDDYVDVAERLATFRELHPTGSVQPADPANAFRVVTIGDATYVAYTAAAYRSPDDPRPGIGSAWEPVPGRTPYTHDSELQNAETAAWGRAIVAALAADTRRGVASRQEIRARHAEPAGPSGEAVATTGLMARINALPDNRTKVACRKAIVATFGQPGDIAPERLAEAEALVATFEAGGQGELVGAKVNGNGNGRAA